MKDELPQRLADWQRENAAPPAATWLVLDANSNVGQKEPGGKLADGSLRIAAKANNKELTYTLTGKTRQPLSFLRIEGLADESLAKSGRAANGTFALSQLTISAKPLGGKEKPVPAKLRPLSATQNENELEHVLDGDSKTAWHGVIGAMPADAKEQTPAPVAASFAIEGLPEAADGWELSIALQFEKGSA